MQLQVNYSMHVLYSRWRIHNILYLGWHVGDIPEEGKEKMMEEGFSIINKKHEMDDIYGSCA